MRLLGLILPKHDELLRSLPNSVGGKENFSPPCEFSNKGSTIMSTARMYRPLKTYPGFRAANLHDLSEMIREKLGAHIIDVDDQPASFEATGNQCKLPSSEMRFCDYGIPITLRFPDTDEVRIQFSMSGAGKTRLGDDVIPVTLESLASRRGRSTCFSAMASARSLGALRNPRCRRSSRRSPVSPSRVRSNSNPNWT